MSLPERQELAKRLARTYEGGKYDTGEAWNRVGEYREVLAYTADHPNKGSHAVSTALELPRSRIRPWMEDGAKPEPVRAIEIAEAHGWLDLRWEEPPFTGLNVLIAWIFAGGSISKATRVPRFAVDNQSQACAKTALERAGINQARIDRANTDHRGTEVVPAEDASVLGRMLAILGAPLGPKRADRELSLPVYLEPSPRAVQLAFARTYVWLRGTPRPDRPETPVQLHEERSPAYREQVQALLEGLVPSAVHGEGNTYRLSAEASAVLNEPPPICHPDGW